MREQQYTRLNQTVYREQLENGLTVLLVPKPGFQQTFATFTTKYGSIDSSFSVDGQDVNVPDGIAHFLEHKLFEKEHGDIFPEFAKHGASANAFTTFDLTSYLFSCTSEIERNTTTLLDFVQDPYFSEKSVEKEKGIIGQEIRMYDDNPDWQVFFNLLKALYQNHPVQIPIAGTVESIADITADTLYQCYNTFYHPANMVFVAVGGFDVSEMMKLVKKNQQSKTFAPAKTIERLFPTERSTVDTATEVVKLSVSQPRCLIGWKDAVTGHTGPQLLKQELMTGLVLDVLFGKSSSVYHQLIDESLIDQNFSWEYECAPTYGYSVIGGNTPDADKLVKRIDEILAEVRDAGLSAEDFERSRRKAIGRFITSMDSPQYIARNFVSYLFKDADFFTMVDVLEEITLDEANQRLREHFEPDQRSVSMVLPN